jgi:S-formylglutathione hydrolase FrmB
MRADRRRTSLYGPGLALLTGALALGAAACGDDGASGTTELRCGEGTSATLTASGTVAVTGDAALDLLGAAVHAQASTTAPAAPVTIACADDIVPPGFIALGPAVSFGPAGAASDRPFELTLPYKAARLPAGALPRHVRIVEKRHVGDGTSFFAPVANVDLDDSDPYASRVSFRASELVTYQAVAPADAGATEKRLFTYRAIAGISMGGNASMSIGLRHRDRFDYIADLGGEPGPSMRYSLSMFQDYLFGGFCTADGDDTSHVGELCADQQRPAATDQFEIRSDFEHMTYQEGDGVGLTLRRDLYMKASRDLSRALGNPAIYNHDSPYAPPGVDAAYLARSAADRCANPTVLHGYFDRELNPTGELPVITFCDGGDSQALGLGVFDPTQPQTNPAEVLLAVDVNGNGRRDAGEPVVTTPYEPFEDVGTDGKASVDEPGYDALTNPDPNGDDWHALRNPRGTEGDRDHQAGEPFEDVGLDGVSDTCQVDGPPAVGAGPCFDFGEGNGHWDRSPGVARWYDSDVEELLGRLDDAGRRRVGIYFDAGIRDFLNASVSANAGFGAMMGRLGLSGAIYDSFGAVSGTSEGGYDFSRVHFADQADNMYLRYGNPDATAQEIELGDGRHVGSAPQVINRVATAFAWLDKKLPNGDRDTEGNGGEILPGQSFTPSTGRVTPYALFLPPGYSKPENAARRYPVVYFLHGYGQEPDDLVQLSSVFATYMVASGLPADQRFQKFLIVYVDGRCRPNVDSVPVPAGGDGCEGGTFYLDAPAGGFARMETNLLELMDHIDATYRTRAPEMVDVVK